MSAPETMTALCEACGTTRTVKTRYIGTHGSSKSLRCSTCARTTLHAPVGVPYDSRERNNARQTEALVMLRRDLEVVRGFGVEVRFVESMPESRGGVQVIRYLDSAGGYAIRLAADRPADATHDALRDAWKMLLDPLLHALDEDDHGQRRDGRPAVSIHRVR